MVREVIVEMEWPLYAEVNHLHLSLNLTLLLRMDVDLPLSPLGIFFPRECTADSGPSGRSRRRPSTSDVGWH